MKKHFLTFAFVALTLMAAPSVEAVSGVWKYKEEQTYEWRREVLEILKSINETLRDLKEGQAKQAAPKSEESIKK